MTKCVADKKLKIYIGILHCITGNLHGGTCIVYFTQIFTPVKCIIINSLIQRITNYIPSFYTLRFIHTCIHHTTNPFFHFFSEDFLFLFWSLFDMLRLGFPCKNQIIDVCCPVARTGTDRKCYFIEVFHCIGYLNCSSWNRFTQSSVSTFLHKGHKYTITFPSIILCVTVSSCILIEI